MSVYPYRVTCECSWHSRNNSVQVQYCTDYLSTLPIDHDGERTWFWGRLSQWRFCCFNARQHPIIAVEECAMQWMGLRVRPLNVWFNSIFTLCFWSFLLTITGLRSSRTGFLDEQDPWRSARLSGMERGSANLRKQAWRSLREPGPKNSTNWWKRSLYQSMDWRNILP